MNRPDILYKYLDVKGAETFLAKPQLRHPAFHELDDICDSLPAFSQLTPAISQQHAIERVARQPVEGVPLDKQIAFYQELGLLPSEYLEKIMRERISEGCSGLKTCICSLVARCDSLAMWRQYAERHHGIVFGIGSDLHRVIADKGRFLQEVVYPESNKRPSTPFNNPKGSDIAQVAWTKGRDWSYQEEWRIISDNPETDFLEPGEVKEVIFGYRYSGNKSDVMRRLIFKDTKFFDAYPSPTDYRMERVEVT
jgi:hypothetical protein